MSAASILDKASRAAGVGAALLPGRWAVASRFASEALSLASELAQEDAEPQFASRVRLMGTLLAEARRRRAAGQR